MTVLLIYKIKQVKKAKQHALMCRKLVCEWYRGLVLMERAGLFLYERKVLRRSLNKAVSKKTHVYVRGQRARQPCLHEYLAAVARAKASAACSGAFMI